MVPAGKQQDLEHSLKILDEQNIMGSNSLLITFTTQWEKFDMHLTKESPVIVQNLTVLSADPEAISFKLWNAKWDNWASFDAIIIQSSNLVDFQSENWCGMGLKVSANFAVLFKVPYCDGSIIVPYIAIKVNKSFM